MFTVAETSPEVIAVLNRVVMGLQLKTKNVFFQTHQESLYYYILHQPREIWKQDVLVFDYGRCLKAHRLQWNPKTVPIVFFSDTNTYSDKAEDKAFLAILKQDYSDERISAVYLLGDGFKGGWMEESLRFLCNRRRVFQGNNLYSKGACYAMKDKLLPDEERNNYIYLGEDKLKANIGMKVQKGGEDAYFALLDAGDHWYEVQAECEVILKSGNEVKFLFTSVTGGLVTEESIDLTDLPKRRNATTRLHIGLTMLSAIEVEIVIEDLGFGEFVPATHKIWKKCIELG